MTIDRRFFLASAGGAALSLAAADSSGPARGEERLAPGSGGRASEPARTEFLFGRLSTWEGRLAAAQRQNLGFYPLSLEEPLDPKPGDPIRIRVRVGVDLSLVRIALFYTVDGGAPDIDNAADRTQRAELQRTETLWDTSLWAYVETWEAELPPQPEGTLLQYCLLGWDFSGRRWPCPSHDPAAIARFPGLVERDLKPLRMRERNGSPQRYAIGVDRLAPPAWFREAVIYQVLVDRFHPDPGGRFFPDHDLSQPLGGTLRGLISRLDYFSALGVTCLWLTPVFAAPAYHGYATTDYMAIEPRLGSAADWDELIRAAHHRGLRVVLDFVANHLSDKHPYFQDAQSDARSRYRHWFRFRAWPNDYASFFDVASQPELQVDHPAAAEHLLEAARHWLARGCDGFRLDYAHGVSHGFWSRFRAAIRQAKSESVSFGEITDTPCVMRSYAGRMDGCLDFRLAELLRGCFALDLITPGEFDRQLQRHLAYFAADSTLVLPTFLDNHDMNRFLWAAGGNVDRLKLAALCQFTLPSPPIIYYGAEVGLSQRRGLGALEEARLPMPWGADQDQGLLSFFRGLIGLRQRIKPWLSSLRPCACDDQAGIYVYRIGDAAVCLNRGPDRDIALSGIGADGPLFMTHPTVQWRPHGQTLSLPGWSGAVLHATADFGVRHV